MGWSAATDAVRVIESWSAACKRQMEVQNVYEAGTGQVFMWETGKEQDDGAIVGSVYRFTNYADNGECVRAGSFRIEPNGNVKRWPTGLLDVVERWSAS